MTSVVLYFQVHQPFRLRRFRFFDIGGSQDYFDDAENERVLRRVAERCYVPMNALLLRAIERTGGRFRCAFSVSGTALDQMERWAPAALGGFRALARTGAVEFLGETSHHSLASLADLREFRSQVRDHRARTAALFGSAPKTFRNTELVADERIAGVAERLGFRAMLAEGADRVLGWRSPRRVYRPRGCRRLSLLLRSYSLSDDVAFRFGDRNWAGWPVTAEKFAGWLRALPPEDRVVGLFMDYETFGEHQWRPTGIFDFMERLPEAVLDDPRFTFETPLEAALDAPAVATLDMPESFSWADEDRGLTAWLGNAMQRSAHDAVYALGPAVRRAARDGDAGVLAAWRRLTTSDHFYYMCTKWFADGDVHKYFNPFETPHDAFIAYMNVVEAVAQRAGRRVREVDHVPG